MVSLDGCDGTVDICAVERGVIALTEAWNAAVEGLESPVPPTQLRALLIIGQAGRPSLGQLAEALGASASATSRLCDRMQAAGLLNRVAHDKHRGVTLILTAPGQRLADWVGDRRRAMLRQLLDAMSATGRTALEEGLRELRTTA